MWLDKKVFRHYWWSVKYCTGGIKHEGIVPDRLFYIKKKLIFG